LKSVIAVQRKWRRLHPGEKVPDGKALKRWLKQFKETGSLAKQKSPGRPGTSEENVERIRLSCVRSPKKSIARRSLELGIPKTTIQNVIHKRLRLYAYKTQHIPKHTKVSKHSRAVFLLDYNSV
jgi:transposase